MASKQFMHKPFIAIVDDPNEDTFMLSYGGYGNEKPVMRSGTISSIVTRKNAVITDGSLFLKLYKNGVFTGEVLEYTSTDDHSDYLWELGPVSASQADTISIRVQTSSDFAHLASNVDIICAVEMEV